MAAATATALEVPFAEASVPGSASVAGAITAPLDVVVVAIAIAIGAAVVAAVAEQPNSQRPSSYSCSCRQKSGCNC